MSNLYKTYKHNEDRANEGVNHDIDGAVFCMAFNGKLNRNWVKTQEQVFKPLRFRKLSQEESRSVEIEIFCKAVLKDWSNVNDENDKPLEFTYDNAKKLLTDLPSLFEVLLMLSSDITFYRDGDPEADSKN